MECEKDMQLYSLDCLLRGQIEAMDEYTFRVILPRKYVGYVFLPAFIGWLGLTLCVYGLILDPEDGERVWHVFIVGCMKKNLVVVVMLTNKQIYLNLGGCF